MDATSNVWHQETIDSQVVDALNALRENAVLTPFYLAGGTALALHLGHRRSVDLDFFSPELFYEDALVQQLQKLEAFSLVAKAPGTLHTHVGGTKVSFLAFDYPLLFPLSAFLGVNVADARDIACMKVSAISGRGTKRDFIDLYAASQIYGLEIILEWFGRKFAAANYSLVHVMKSLTYFEDAEKDPAPDMLTAISWEDARRYFILEVPPLL